MNKNFYFSILLLIYVLGFESKAFSQTVPPMFVDELVNNSWDQVEGFVFDANKNMYVYEKNGAVWRVDSNGVKEASPLINLREEVGGWRDHGLNGFALDPNFNVNGYIYLAYTVDRHHLLYFGTPQYNANTDLYFNATIIRVTRYQVDVANNNYNSIVPGSRFVLIGATKKTGIPLMHESHSGGQIVFGDDGTLLVSTGDGANYNNVDPGNDNGTYYAQGLLDSIIRPAENVGAFRSQLVNCLAGKVLRIDPQTGAGLPTNPFYNPANPYEPKSLVWSLGLRNPFRMTIRRGSGNIDPTAGDPGTLYIGDVGWTQWEDLHTAEGPGQNFGWPLFEGINANTSYTATNTQNLDAPNPLFGVAGCTQQYFYFKDLLKQATLSSSNQFPNPCNNALTIPASIPVFLHERPDIDWIHGNQSRTPSFSGVNSVAIDIDNAASPVPGPRFGGYASCGGVWYTATRFPLIYQNTYFHADYGGSWIRNFTFDANDKPVAVRNFGTNLGPVVFVNAHPSDGSLMYVKYPTDIRRIRYTGTINNPPRAVVQVDAYYGAAPLTVNCNGALSSDPENLAMTYLWDFGDGTTSTQMNVSHVFTTANSNPLTRWVKLTVTDNIGQTSKDSVRIFLNNTPPQVDISSFENGDFYSILAPFNLALQANVSDLEHPEPSLKYKWQTVLHHNFHEHIEAVDTNRITQSFITIETCTETFYYEIRLTVTDPEGLSTSVSESIYPACGVASAGFSADLLSACINKPIQFTNASDQSVQYQWLFPGGSPSSSTAKNPSVSYSLAGAYDVKLIASNGVTSDTLLLPAYINIYNKPTTTLIGNSTVIYCNGSTVTLKSTTNASNPSYQWYLNNLAVSNATNDSIVAATAGFYKVKVTDDAGCFKNSNSVKLVETPKLTLTTSGPLSFCVGDSVVLSAFNSSNYSYQWYRFSAPIQGAVQSQYSVKTAGRYYALITDVNAGCTGKSSRKTVSTPCRLNESATGVEETSLSVFPNPVVNTAVLTIANATEGVALVNVLDLRGRVVLSQSVSLTSDADQWITLPMEKVESGLYLIQLLNGTNNPTVKIAVGGN